jgi:pilus assembly protein Flp/PilA
VPPRFEVLEISMLSIFRRLMKNAQGATAIEYTLIASLIAVAAIASMRTVGGKVSNVLNNVSNVMT